MIHLVFTKHHNLVAEKLADLNPNWDHEKLLEVSSYGTVMYTSIFISWLLLRHYVGYNHAAINTAHFLSNH